MLKTSRARSLVTAGGVLAIGAALLAGGGFIGNSLAGAQDDEPSGLTVVYVPVAGGAGAAASTAAPPSTNGDDASEGSGSSSGGATNPAPGYTGMPGYGGASEDRGGIGLVPPGQYGFCPAPIDAAVSGGAINPAALGFTMNLLGSGFSLQSINLRGEVDCEDPDGDVSVVLDTSWSYGDNEFTVWVSQRESAEPTANVMYDGYAQFWSQGYSYSVSAGYIYYYYDDVAGGAETHDGDIDSQASQAVLLQVIAQLAPDVPQQCFFQPVNAEWSALADLGVGDPRPAIPAGFVEQGVWAQVFSPPAAGCDVPENVDLPVSFGAQWSAGDGSWLSINIYRAYNDYYGYGGPLAEVGYSNDYSVSWSNGTYRFDVYGNNRDSGIGVATLQAIARALDPQFDNACLLVERQLTEAELEALGVGTADAPGGYVLESSRAVVSEPNANCDLDVEVGNISADWQFTGPGGEHISASAWLDKTYPPDGSWYGWIGQGYINWVGPNGVNYSVSGWSEAGGPVDQETLIGVALSMDPTLDVGQLEDGDGGGRPIPLAEPAVDAAVAE